METLELKNRIQHFLERADERVLNIVNSVFENYYDNETVAYYPNGSPMTRKEYKERLDIGLEQTKKGDYISVEELEKELDRKFEKTTRK